jgi:hypothetical protein
MFIDRKPQKPPAFGEVSIHLTTAINIALLRMKKELLQKQSLE